MASVKNPKIKLAVFVGARSTEHEVSLASSYNIVNAIDRGKYEVFVVGIDKQGVWRQYDPDNFVISPKDFKNIALGQPISGRLAVAQSSRTFYDLENDGKPAFDCDVVFPAILGNYAEDGTMQGLLRVMDVPFTTPDVLGSATGMDKDVMKRLWRDAGLNVAKYILVRKNLPWPSYDDVRRELGDTVFIKPSNAGSSVGVNKAKNAKQFANYLKAAFRYDVKVIVEEAIAGREIEVSMMGNIGQQKFSLLGEVVEKNKDDFYSYENKYINGTKVDLIAPAKVTDDQLSEVHRMARVACEALECEGFSRIDFFLEPDGRLVINEINTMPGFTNISMFPRLWEISGIPYPELVDRLIELALERYDFRIAPIVVDGEEVLRHAIEEMQKQAET